MLKPFATLIAIAAIAGPADAHWQWTKWGMTPDQVVAASKGTVTHADPAQDAEMPFGTKQAVGTYTRDGRAMRASFWFKTGKLRQVNLATDDEDECSALKRDLTTVYGRATASSGGMIETNVWRDAAKGNRVQFSDWGTQGCDLIYAPLASSASTGL